MIKGFVEGKKYKCIDVEGYENSGHYNPVCITKYFDEEFILRSWEGLTVDYDGWLVSDTYYIISESEFKYFSLVEEEGEGTLLEDSPSLSKDLRWDGKEDLEVGMLVGSTVGEALYVLRQINHVEGDNLTQYLIQETYTDLHKTLHLVSLDEMYTLVPDKKQEFSGKVLEKWRRTSLDTAHDSEVSTAPIGDIIDICWDVFEKGGHVNV